MKPYLLITPLLLVTALNCRAQQQNKLETLNWLPGKWQRTNVKAGQTGYETWQKVSPDRFEGSGLTLRGTDTVFFERLQIIEKPDGLYYVAETAQNNQAVYFKFTEATATGFVCENPEHDFPKKITYQLTGNTIQAAIHGDGKSIPFNFVRISPQ